MPGRRRTRSVVGLTPGLSVFGACLVASGKLLEVLNRIGSVESPRRNQRADLAGQFLVVGFGRGWRGMIL